MKKAHTTESARRAGTDPERDAEAVQERRTMEGPSPERLLNRQHRLDPGHLADLSGQQLRLRS